MTFNEILAILRDSDIDDKVKFKHDGMSGYFIKEDFGEFVYYLRDEKADIQNFYLSDFDRDDWCIIK